MELNQHIHHHKYNLVCLLTITNAHSNKQEQKVFHQTTQTLLGVAEFIIMDKQKVVTDYDSLYHRYQYKSQDLLITEIKTTNAPNLQCHMYNIEFDSIQSFKYYDSLLNGDQIYKFIVQLVPDLSAGIYNVQQYKWFQNKNSHKYKLYFFSEKKSATLLVKGISSNFYGLFDTCLISKPVYEQIEQIRNDFQIDKWPQIVVVDRHRIEYYNQVIKYSLLQNYLSKYQSYGNHQQIFYELDTNKINSLEQLVHKISQNDYKHLLISLYRMSRHDSLSNIQQEFGDILKTYEYKVVDDDDKQFIQTNFMNRTKKRVKLPMLIYLPVGNVNFKMKNRILVQSNKDGNYLKEKIRTQLQQKEMNQTQTIQLVDADDYVFQIIRCKYNKKIPMMLYVNEYDQNKPDYLLYYQLIYKMDDYYKFYDFYYVHNVTQSIRRLSQQQQLKLPTIQKINWIKIKVKGKYHDGNYFFESKDSLTVDQIQNVQLETQRFNIGNNTGQQYYHYIKKCYLQDSQINKYYSKYKLTEISNDWELNKQCSNRTCFLLIVDQKNTKLAEYQKAVESLKQNVQVIEQNVVYGYSIINDQKCLEQIHNKMEIDRQLVAIKKENGKQLMAVMNVQFDMKSVLYFMEDVLLGDLYFEELRYQVSLECEKDEL